MYSRLPPEPQRKEPQIDLFPDTQDGDSKPGLANYLDEFLSAIRVFGYLERPVFHGLTRTMQTRKLIAGETLLLEEENGFCLVVDGLVQIFVKSNLEGYGADDRSPIANYTADDSMEDDEHQHEGHQGYQLLTEVKNGASMSSLFSILSLFTEDVRLRHTGDGESSPSSVGPSPGRVADSNPASPPELAQTPMGVNFHEHRNSIFQPNGNPEKLPSIPPLTLEDSNTLPRPTHNARFPRHLGPPKPKKRKSIHPDIVARAMVDTTIAIIPASAFRRLTRVYPKATAHIIQVILTRLQRVTFATAHSYLGLTTEVLSIEKQMNKYTAYDLPNHLRGVALDRLKDKFTKERDRIGSEGMKGIALHNPAANRRRRSSSSLRKDAVLYAKLLAAQGQNSVTNPARFPNRDISSVSPGDLLSTIQLSRSRPLYRSEWLNIKGGLHRQSTSFGTNTETQLPHTQGENQPSRSPIQNSTFHRQDSVDQDSVFRESILDCMIKALGLTGSTRDVLQRNHNSGDASPQLVSYDSKRQKAVFNNAFGYIDPYEAFGDADSESVMSISATSAGGTSPLPRLREELKDDIEIVFFPKGSVLVEQGERNPGLYYVIDGFLDVGIPVNDKGEDLFGSPRTGRSHDELFSP